MFTLAQLSDWHIASRPGLFDLAGKRGLGYINWQRGRKYIHRRDVLDLTIGDLKAQSFEHIAVTGDLVNLSLAAEYALARDRLELLGGGRNVSVVPGNHDVYVHGVEGAPARYWGDYMRGDDGELGFPYLRRRSDVALIALSTGLPTAPFLAIGELGEAQLTRLAAMLRQTAGAFRVVLIHHPPVTPPHRHLRRLVDAAALDRVLKENGAELLLHGHDHARAVVWLDGPGETKIPAVGVPSASSRAPHGEENGAGYNLFQIEGAAGQWRCVMIGRERDSNGVFRDAERRTLA